MKYNISIKEKQYQVEVIEVKNNIAVVTVNGETYEAKIENLTEFTSTPKNAESTSKSKAESAAKPAPPAKETSPVVSSGDSIIDSIIKAPIPGLIISVNVKVGDKILAGETLAIMEAMKMENNIVSDAAGVIKEIRIQKGSEVKTSEVMFVIGV